MMSLTGVAKMRVHKEMQMLYVDPPPGISAWAKEEDSREIEAVVEGAEGTPYANGRFRLQLSMPQRYPFEPPKVHYVTPIYHPNIDSAGRICLDILNLPPKGAWKPSLNISTVLQSLRLLMAEPNPDDGLMVDITHQYTHDHARFERTAAEHTRRHACGSEVDAGSTSGGGTIGEEAATSGAADADAAAPPAAAPAAAPPPAAAAVQPSAEEGDAAAAASASAAAKASNDSDAVGTRGGEGEAQAKRPKLCAE